MQLSNDFRTYFEDFDTQSAYAFYEAIRGRLPTASFPAQAQYMSGLLDVTPHCDVFVFDAFGVLNVGQTAIAGAAKCVAALRDMGKQVYIITNAASLPKAQSLQKFQNLGFDFTGAEIVTSRMAAENALATKPVGLWGVMSKVDFSPDDLPVNCILLEEDAAVYDQVDGFVFLSTWAWTAKRHEILMHTLANNPRPILVANPDVIAPLEARFSTEPGYVAHVITDHFGIECEFHGKPFPSVFELVEAKLPANFDRSRICMIGDTLHTDVLGGASRGWSTVLVSDHGLFRGHDVKSFIADCGIVPTFVVPSI